MGRSGREMGKDVVCNQVALYAYIKSSKINLIDQEDIF